MQISSEKNTSLDEEIRSRIAEISAVADDLPGVIIIHNNHGQNVLYMSQRGLDHLGITLQEAIEMGPAYYDRFFNPEEAKEYVPKIFAALERNDPMEWVSFFQQVRPTPEHDWEWYASSTKIFLRDEEGKPRLSITVAVPLDLEHHLTNKVDRLQKENVFLRKNYHKFALLTEREREILKYTVLGKSSNETAEILFISPATVDTHRKNLRQKLEANSSYDLTQYASAFDLI